MQTTNHGTAAAALIACAAALATSGSAADAQEKPNACPVDGCVISIVGVEKHGDEIEVTFEANFTPDVSKNHIHVWWGDRFTVEQAGRAAETHYGVKQGVWHRHDQYPVYVTTEGASTSIREGSTTLCVTAADRDHNVLDVALYHCMDVSGSL
jgi:hypothetical protein